MAKRKFIHFVPRPKPRKRPRRHKKSLSKSEKRSYKKYNRQGRWQYPNISYNESMKVNKFIRSKIERDYFFIKGNLNIDCEYFITEIEKGIQRSDNKSFKTNTISC